eukprot:7575128-Alexandrium_andersonii.AAC.1
MTRARPSRLPRRAATRRARRRPRCSRRGSRRSRPRRSHLGDCPLARVGLLRPGQGMRRSTRPGA